MINIEENLIIIGYVKFVPRVDKVLAFGASFSNLFQNKIIINNRIFNELLNKVYDHFNTLDGEYLMIFFLKKRNKIYHQSLHVWIFKLIP